MKRHVFSFVMFLLTLASCDRVNDIQPQTDDSVPVVVLQAIQKSYPAAQSVTFTSLEKGRVWEANFTFSAARLSAFLKADGQFLETTRQATTTALPEPASSYIRKMFPGATIEAIAEVINDGKVAGYKVAILDGGTTRTLMFDQMGRVVLVTNESSSGSSTTAYSVAKADLPQPILNYLTTTLGASYVFEKAGAMLKGDQKMYTVVVRKEATITALYFDGTGSFLKSEVFAIATPSSSVAPAPAQKITPNDITAGMKTYLDKAYPGWTFSKGEVNSGLYYIYILVDSKMYIVVFDGNSTFLKSADGGSLTPTPPPAPSTSSTQTLAASDITAGMKTYLDKTYPGWTFSKGEAYLTNKSIVSYYIYIKVDLAMYVVEFDKSSVFVTAKKL